MFQSEIIDSGLVLVPPADPEKLASAISTVYKNYDDLRQKLKTRDLYEIHLSNTILKSCVDSALESVQL